MSKKNKNKFLNNEDIVETDETLEESEGEVEGEVITSEEGQGSDELGTTPEEVTEQQDGQPEVGQEASTEGEVKQEAEEQKVATETQPIVDEPTKVTAKKVEDFTSVNAILNDSKLSNREKIQALTECDNLKIKLFTNILTDYNANMKSIKNPETANGYNYDLYVAIKGAVNATSKAEFNVKFNILQLVFFTLKNESFNELVINKYMHLWNWGSVSRNFFENIVTMIFILQDPKKKELHLNGGILDKVLDKDTNGVSDIAIENIRSYYKG